MPQSYTLYSIITDSDHKSVPLGDFFAIPGVADISRQNLKWQWVDINYSLVLAEGDILKNGTLVPNSSLPAPYIFRDHFPYEGYLELQIQFDPDPCQRCDECEEDASGQKCCPASSQSPNSVELATGRFVFEKNLLSLAALGAGGWSFDLNYKSNFGIEGILGKNFAYPQYMHLEQLRPEGSFYFSTARTNLELVTNQLSKAIFTDNLDGTYTPLVGNNTGCTLIATGSGISERFILTAANGTRTTFFGFDLTIATPGLIESIVDRHGNSQELAWIQTDGIPQLLSVTDAYGRIMRYDYYGSEGNYRLKLLTDFLGRQLNFQYDTEDHLVAVITPSILKAAPGNTFPGGTAYVFQFDVKNADPARRNDLIRIWYPNETRPFLDVETRVVDVEAVYASATPRYQITYGQNVHDNDTYGKVLTETLGDPESEIGGTAYFEYTSCPDDLPFNRIDPEAAIVNRTLYTDRNGNRSIYDFNAFWTVSRRAVELNRNKCSLEVNNQDHGGVAPVPFVIWTKFNSQNQPLVIIYPEGNSVENTYETGDIEGIPSTYGARRGLLLKESRLPGNSLGLPSRLGSGDQTVLTRRYFYEPIFTQLCAVIEERGNPVDGSTFFTPQNGGTTPTYADCSRYSTLSTFDYQKDALATISGDVALQELLGLTSTEIETLIAFVDSQMKATDGTGGIPVGFPVNLGDINGDGTGDGASSGLPAASHLGNILKVTHPSVRLVGGTSQSRIELFTVNLRGQITTATDPEGNLTVTTRYPENDPEGDGQNISSTLSTQQYGLVREIHRDANPDDVISLVGASGDMVDFVPNLIDRTNTPGVYQDLITRYEGSSGCTTCAYDPMGNVLNETDPRGFTTVYDRNEVGEVYRVTSPAPYNFRVESFYDANRNVTRIDKEDMQVQYNSFDPTSSEYGKFRPSGSGTTAHVPMIPGPGGPVRPGWFSNLMSYDILDDKIEDDIDATGSTPSNLVTRYQHDANQNLTKIIKPEGNTVEYDYDERDLKITQRVGGSGGAVTGYSYDGNKNLLCVIGPIDHNVTTPYPIPPPTYYPSETALTAYITNAFGSDAVLTVSGDWIVQNTYDGFDRVVTATDAVGGVVNSTYDPTAALIAKETRGTIGGPTPMDRYGSDNASLANAIMRFDEASRLYEQQMDVFLASEASLPSSRAVTHTGGGLAANSTANNHTSTVTLTTGGASYVLNRTIYDRSSRVSATLTDNTAQTSYAYDGAGRRLLVTDPLGNTVATEYDGNGNATRVTKNEICTITAPTVANEIFVIFAWYDSLNRRVVAGSQGADGWLTDDLGICCSWQGQPSTLFSVGGYDSRGNQVTVADPKLNVVVSVYDGASRLVEIQQEMRKNGDGRNAPASNQTFLTAGGGVIRTEYVYDGNSRLTELVDDRGASTVYGYDLLDRQVTKTLADGSISTKVYDLAGNVTGFTDENGSVFAYTFDALSRKITVVIAQATGVIGTTAQSFQYDGLSRNTQAIDTVVSTSAEVDFVYDSLNRVLEETQIYGGQTRSSSHTAWTSLPATQVTYPTADITLNNTYDLLYRRNLLTGTSTAHGTLDTVKWEFFGQVRIVETNYGNGSLIATQMNNARTNSAVQETMPLPDWGNISSDRLGYDGVGRLITKRYLTGGINGTSYGYNSTTALVGYTTAFDRASNKLYERHLEAESRSHLYQPFNSDGSFGVGYDSANRLLQYQRGVLSTATIPYRVNAGASIDTPITLPGTDQVRTYGLDGLGNWKTSNFTLVGSGGSTTSTAQVRQHNYVNEITSVKDTTGGIPTSTAFAYDHGGNIDGIRGNGNLAFDGVRRYQWDALNRLIKISKADNTVLATYVYDAFERRIQKSISNLGGGFGGLTGDIPAGTTDYIYDGQQIIEERNHASPMDWKQIFFWGKYIDELLFLSVPTATVYRVLSDLLYRSTALMTTANVITEAYDTDACGNTLCYSGPGTDGLWFTYDDVRTNTPINTTIFTGRQFDPESLIYYYRSRYYNPTLGTFISRDPISVNDEINMYSYVGNRSPNRVDPTGLISYEVDESKCLLNVGMKWTLFFDPMVKYGKMPWPKHMRDEWKAKAKSSVEEYFSSLAYACFSECCKCKNGIKVKFDLQFVDFGADYTVSIAYGKLKGDSDKDDPRGGVGVTPGYPTAQFDQVTPIFGSHIPNQNTAVHETGHMLGLNHPGQKLHPPSPRGRYEDYDADSDSLMGRGMELRLDDFKAAFCDKIHTMSPSGKPCVWTANSV